MPKDPRDDPEVGVCTECHSVQDSRKLVKNPFFQQGGAIPCQWCSGVVIITHRDNVKNALKQSNRERGI